MYEITCFDSNGDSIDHFNQWDINQKIVIKLYGCDDDYLKYPPVVHFSNSKSKEARRVRSTVTDGNTLTANVPNVLLQESLPLFISVYLTDSDNETSQRTILSDEIIVRKQPKPSDYYYIENIERITANQIKREVKNELGDDINKSHICFSGISLIDAITKKPYEIYTSDGKLMIEEIPESEAAYNSVTFVDRADKNRYKIYVSSGKLYLDRVY